MNGDQLRTPGVAPDWANDDTTLLVEDELPIWSRNFHDDHERFQVNLSTEDRMTGDGFHAQPNHIEVYTPTMPPLSPAEAVRLADTLYAAAKAAGVEPHTTR